MLFLDLNRSVPFLLSNLEHLYFLKPNRCFLGLLHLQVQPAYKAPILLPCVELLILNIVRVSFVKVNYRKTLYDPHNHLSLNFDKKVLH